MPEAFRNAFPELPDSRLLGGVLSNGAISNELLFIGFFQKLLQLGVVMLAVAA